MKRLQLSLQVEVTLDVQNVSSCKSRCVGSRYQALQHELERSYNSDWFFLGDENATVLNL